MRSCSPRDSSNMAWREEEKDKVLFRTSTHAEHTARSTRLHFIRSPLCLLEWLWILTVD